MNEIVNKFLLSGDKFMPKMHSHIVFVDHLQNKKKEHKNLKKQDIYQNKLDKAYFQQNMAHGDSKDLTRRTASDKILHDKTFNIAKNLNYDGYQRGIASMVYKFFHKKTTGGAIKNESA